MHSDAINFLLDFNRFLPSLRKTTEWSVRTRECNSFSCFKNGGVVFFSLFLWHRFRERKREIQEGRGMTGKGKRGVGNGQTNWHKGNERKGKGKIGETLSKR